MKPLRTLAVLALFLGIVSSAQAARSVAPTPLPALPTFELNAVTSQAAEGCGTIYSNTQSAGYYFPAGAGVEVADDLHMLRPGHLCGIDFGYHKSTPGVTGAAIAFYANDPTDDIQPYMLLAGPYVVNDLPSGTGVVHLDFEPGTGPPDLTQDIWLGISFSTDETGLLVAGPPTVGTSHDLLYWTPPGEIIELCGELIADFYLVVYANEFTVPTGTTSWGRLKQLYR